MLAESASSRSPAHAPESIGIIDTFRTATSFARGLRERAILVALACAHAAGCGTPTVDTGPPVTEGGAILAALEHVAESKWGESGTIMIRGQAAVEYRGEEPLSESTRLFLDEAIAVRGWRWSTEDPLVPTGNCVFPSGDCRLKNPTELHLTFSVWPWPGEEDYSEEELDPFLSERFRVDPVPGEEGYKVSVGWLSSLRDGSAESGGEGVLVTRGTNGLVVTEVLYWIS